MENNKNSIQLGKTLKKVREQNFLSLTQLTVKTGMSSPYLSNIESGKRNISFNTLCLILEALDYSLDDFFKEYVKQNKKKDE